MDNCDECINIQKQEFQDALDDILLYSYCFIKVLTTSQEETLHSGSYHVHKLAPLSRKSACKLLEQKIPLILNETEKENIAELTGEVPLALQVIGSLLSINVDPPTPAVIITKLKKNPIPTLSSPLLTRKMQLNYFISVSYNFLHVNYRKLLGILRIFQALLMLLLQ